MPTLVTSLLWRSGGIHTLSSFLRQLQAIRNRLAFLRALFKKRPNPHCKDVRGLPVGKRVVFCPGEGWFASPALDTG